MGAYWLQAGNKNEGDGLCLTVPNSTTHAPLKGRDMTQLQLITAMLECGISVARFSHYFLREFVIWVLKILNIGV